MLLVFFIEVLNDLEPARLDLDIPDLKASFVSVLTAFGTRKFLDSSLKLFVEGLSESLPHLPVVWLGFVGEVRIFIADCDKLEAIQLLLDVSSYLLEIL